MITGGQKGEGWRRENTHSLLKYPPFRKGLFKIPIVHPDVMDLRVMLDALFDLTSDMYVYWGIEAAWVNEKIGVRFLIAIT